MEISLVFQEHPDAEIWEEYTFGRLDEACTGGLEEHLLLCERCQAELKRSDHYILGMKDAAERLARETPARKPRRVLALPVAGRAGGIPVAAALVAACIASAMWVMPRGASLAPVQVALSSLRGGAESVMNRAPAGHPLELSIRSTGMPPGRDYRLEVVTSAGQLVWSGSTENVNGEFSSRVRANLRAGTYWVRLYGPSAELLAEYGLKLE